MIIRIILLKSLWYFYILFCCEVSINIELNYIEIIVNKILENKSPAFWAELLFSNIFQDHWRMGYSIIWAILEVIISFSRNVLSNIFVRVHHRISSIDKQPIYSRCKHIKQLAKSDRMWKVDFLLAMHRISTWMGNVSHKADKIYLLRTCIS